jgi:hypothetical protein
VVQAIVNLLDGLSFVQMVVRFNHLRFEEVGKVNLLLQKFFDDFLSLSSFEGIEAMSLAAIVFGLDESRCVHLCQ